MKLQSQSKLDEISASVSFFFFCINLSQRGAGAAKSELPWKPAVQCGRPADQVEVVCLVDGQGLVDVTVGIDIGSHGAIQ